MDTNKTEEMIIRRDVMGFVYSATPLVRCKDCKHFDGIDCRVNDIVNIMNTEWFCADGEKRTD